MLCSTCTGQVYSKPVSERLCPECRGHMPPTKVLNRFYSQTADQFEYSCRLKGCNVKIKLAELQTHEEVCEHRPFLCPCGERYPMLDLWSHMCAKHITEKSLTSVPLLAEHLLRDKDEAWWRRLADDNSLLATAILNGWHCFQREEHVVVVRMSSHASGVCLTIQSTAHRLNYVVTLQGGHGLPTVEMKGVASTLRKTRNECLREGCGLHFHISSICHAVLADVSKPRQVSLKLAFAV